MSCCEILSKYEVIYDTFEKTGELIGFAPHIRFEVSSAYRLVHPHYQHNDSCPACIAEMITTIYRWYKKFKSEQGL